MTFAKTEKRKLQISETIINYENEQQHCDIKANFKETASLASRRQCSLDDDDTPKLNCRFEGSKVGRKRKCLVHVDTQRSSDPCYIWFQKADNFILLFGEILTELRVDICV